MPNDTTDIRIRKLPKTVHRAIKQIALDNDTSAEQIYIQALTEFVASRANGAKGGRPKGGKK